MELNGALSNPLATDNNRFAKLAAMKQRALERVTVPEKVPPIGRRQGAVLASVTIVLERAGQPMFVEEIHSVVEDLLGEPVPSSSMKDAFPRTRTAATAGSGGSATGVTS
jgi:hypothetical protein